MVTVFPGKIRFLHIFNIPALAVCLILYASQSYSQMPPHHRLLNKISSGEIRIPKELPLQEHSDDPSLQKSVMIFPWQNNSLNNSSSKEFNLLVVLVDFDDKVHSTSAEYFDKILFSPSFLSLRNYFSEVSCGKMNITTVNLPSEMGWIRAPESYSYYTSGGNYGMGSYPNNTQKLAEDVVKKIDPYVDFSKYDNDGDGYVDALMIVHSGKGAEYSGNKDDIWSYATSMEAIRTDGVAVYKYAVCSEYYEDSKGDMTIGSFAHEFSHSYFGLGDLYDLDYSSKGLGKWSLMSSGCWNGVSAVGGDIPAYPDAYCRVHMGFAKAHSRTFKVKDLSISPTENDSTQIYKVWYNELYSEKEYFLIENRLKKGFDRCLPGQGLLIYHIDENASGNGSEWYPGHTSLGHYMVSLVQADNKWDLERNVNLGDDGDPFPGSQNNTVFSSSSSPNSKSYTGNDTKVEISNIRKSGDTVIADINLNLVYDASIKVLSPVKGERVRTDGYYAIKWMSQKVSKVSIQYSSDAGRSWNIITANSDDVTGMFWWRVPNINGDSCKIRITDLAYPANCIESDYFAFCSRPIWGSPAAKGDLAFTQVITGASEGFELLVLKDIDITSLRISNSPLDYYLLPPSDKPLINMSQIDLGCYAVANQGTYIRFVKDTVSGYHTDSAEKILTVSYVFPALNLTSAPLSIFRNENGGLSPIAGFDLTGKILGREDIFFSPNTLAGKLPSGIFSNYRFNEPIKDLAGNIINAVRLPENWAADNSQSGFNDKDIKFSLSDGIPFNLKGGYSDYSVVIRWSVIEENSNQGWQIERRTLNTDWATVGYKPSLGRYGGSGRPYSFVDKSVVPPETYYYRLRQISRDNTSGCSHSIKVTASLSPSYILEQNYPNPSNGSTAIVFSLPVPSSVRFTIYNSLGQTVQDNDLGIIPAGVNKIDISLDKFSSGIYFYTLKASSQIDQSTFVKSRKMMVIK